MLASLILPALYLHSHASSLGQSGKSRTINMGALGLLSILDTRYIQVSLLPGAGRRSIYLMKFKMSMRVGQPIIIIPKACSNCAALVSQPSGL